MRTFKDYNPDQRFLLPPALQDWLPEGHLALLLSDLVDELDLTEFFFVYSRGDGRGQPPYHPGMMVKLLLYAYCTGRPSSRKIEEATYTDVAFRVLSANQHPDHDSLSEFRKRHLKAFSNLFVQVLQLCAKSGMVKLGRVAVDGTKVKANASKHKAMSYDRMVLKQQKLEEEINALLAQAEAVDAAEDEQYGKESRGDELPEELKRRKSRLAVIRAARKALEEEAREAAIEQAAAAKARIKEREQQEAETGKKAKGRPPNVPDPEQAKPEAKAQRNFTDPESRIMIDGATKGFEQAYNAQIVVDGHCQIIVAAEITDQANDKMQLSPLLQQTQENLGRKPEAALADSGYFSEAAVSDPSLDGIELYVAVGRQKHGEETETVDDPAPEGASIKEQMEHKLKTEAGKAAYRLRKSIVEPVFGQIKEARRFRRFLFRGKKAVKAEWMLICLTHNILKLTSYLRASRNLTGDALLQSSLTQSSLTQGAQGAVALHAA